MTVQVLIAGGGIGGMAAALALSRAGADVQVHERAPIFSEAGAGIQLGPNATRVLRGWGLNAHLRELAAVPSRLRILRAQDGTELAQMPLGNVIEARYGSPYLTVHRADLHRLLLTAAQGNGARLHAGSRIDTVDGFKADAVIAADGLWSSLRSQVVRSAAPRATGHVAYRSLVEQSALPAVLRSDEVRVWLGWRMHVVAYPVRAGDALNMVALVEATPPADARDWDGAATAASLHGALGPVDANLRRCIDAMPAWRLWTLHDRVPLKGPQEMVRGRIALLGDAAHPMLPYLAQGAGMAIEDAQALALVLPGDADDMPWSLQRYAHIRWKRCARVQRTARRNSLIFHASGPMRWARDTAMAVLGERLIDQPWLFR